MTRAPVLNLRPFSEPENDSWLIQRRGVRCQQAQSAWRAPVQTDAWNKLGPTGSGSHDWPRLLAVAKRTVPYFIFGCQRASAAPVGSMRTLNEPMPMTSVTSFITVAPSDLAFFVEAATS